MANGAIENGPSQCTINLLKPVDLVLQLIQHVIDTIICQIEWIINLLTGRKLPKIEPIYPQGALYQWRPNREEIYNVLDVPRLVLDYQLHTIRSIRSMLSDIIGLPIHLVTKPLTFGLGFTVHEINMVTDWVQPYLSLKLPKLHIPFGETDFSNFELKRPFSDFAGKLQGILPFTIRNPFSFRFPNGKGITQLEKYNKELVELLDKERQKHYKDLSNLTAIDKEGDKTNERLEKDRREFDALKQELLDKIALEMEKHKEDVENLTKKSDKEKAHADLELEKLKDDYEKKIRETRSLHQKEIDDLIALRRDDKTKTDGIIDQLNKDIAAQKQSFLDKIENERKDCNVRIDKIKSESGSASSNQSLLAAKEALVIEKKNLLDQIAKEREDYLKQLDKAEAKCRDQKTNSDLIIDQLKNDFAKQKQDLLNDLAKERDSTQQQIQTALDSQKNALNLETGELKNKLLTLQTKCDALEKAAAKDKGLFGKINETLSKPAEVADKVTKPLQDTGFGKIFS